VTMKITVVWNVTSLNSFIVGYLMTVWASRLYRTINECRAVDGMMTSMGNQSTWRKPSPVPHWQQQIPYDVTWDRTRAATGWSHRLICWAMARSEYSEDGGNWFLRNFGNYSLTTWRQTPEDSNFQIRSIILYQWHLLSRHETMK
jgi:hypothetical protein